ARRVPTVQHTHVGPMHSHAGPARSAVAAATPSGAAAHLPKARKTSRGLVPEAQRPSQPPSAQKHSGLNTLTPSALSLSGGSQFAAFCGAGAGAGSGFAGAGAGFCGRAGGGGTRLRTTGALAASAAAFASRVSRAGAGA